MKFSLSTTLPANHAIVLVTEHISSEIQKKISPDIVKIIKNTKKSEHWFAIPAGLVGKNPIFIIAKKTETDDESVRKLGADIAKKLTSYKVDSVSIVADKLENQWPNLITGFMLAAYAYDDHKKDTSHRFKKGTFLCKKINAHSKQACQEAITLAESVNYVRDLVNKPANEIFPVALSKEAQKIAKSHKKIKATVWGERKIKAHKLNALYSVGKGSQHESQLIVLDYKGGKKNDPYLAVVGKGITFDSGGVNMKIGSNINLMKFDMAGAATVLGLFKMLSKYDLPINVVGVVASAENMLDSAANKPNDIIETYKGLTVEITNTDAEGRLVLADGLSYVEKNYKPATILDFATLTGASIVALGYTTSAVLGNNQKAIDKLLAASKATGEKAWQLPIDEDHRKQVKGDFSDLKNHTPSAKAGTIMGAAFLSYFIEDTPWVHVDMGGSAWTNNAHDYYPKGASGRNVRLLWEFAKSFSN